MAELAVASTYAKALFDAAADAKKEELIGDELKELENLLSAEPDFFEFLKTPLMDKKTKKEAIADLFKDKLSSETINFLFILIDKRRAGELFKIADQYWKMFDRKMNVSDGEIYTAMPLKREQIEVFAEKVSQLINKNVKLVNITDKSIIGGVKIIIEGKVIDATVKKRLKEMYYTLKH